MGLVWKDFFLNGWGPGFTPGTGQLGNVILSGLQAMVFSYSDYVKEHEIVAREGGIVERIGSQLGVAKFHGFFEGSGAEAMWQTLQSYRGTTQSLSFVSFISGNMFFSGVINVNSLESYPAPGYGYPFYYWRLEGKVSGVLG